MAHLVESGTSGLRRTAWQLVIAEAPAEQRNGPHRARPSTARATPQRRATRRRASCARRAARPRRQRSRRDGRLDHAHHRHAVDQQAGQQHARHPLPLQRSGGGAALPAARYCPAGRPAAQRHGARRRRDRADAHPRHRLRPRAAAHPAGCRAWRPQGRWSVPVAKTSSWPSVRDSVPPAITSPLGGQRERPERRRSGASNDDLAAGRDSQHAERQRRRALARDIDR